jgi:2-oxoisovalerate dehydrogenase E1 component
MSDNAAAVLDASTDAGTALGLYRRMQLIRKCELQLAKAAQQGLVHGACHTYVGQEAVAAGVCVHLAAEDVVFSTHRGHGHALAKGLPAEALMAELYGRQTGCSFGRGGSMHLFAPEVGMMGTSGIVGPCILQAAGAGYSFQLLQNGRVAVAFFGDGAVSNGAFHEGVNLAAVWKLPVLFVCENNQFATEVPFAQATRNPQVANRGAAYGLPGVAVDGNDVLAVMRAAGAALDRARRGEGPTLLECRTYRTRPHAEGMVDFTYRTREEVDAWKQRCPIETLRRRIEAGEFGPVDDKAVAEIDAAIDQLVKQAHAAAREAPYPETSSATRFVFAQRDDAAATDRVRLSAGNGRAAGAPPAETARELTFAEAGREALADAMRDRPEVFVLGEGIGQRGGNFNTTSGLYAQYGPLRLRDTPICERGFIGLAAGAAMTGARPVVDFMFADFILDAVGEILNQIAKIQYMSGGRLRMPLILRGCFGIGHSAATHHSGSYYAMYAHFPGLRVVVPSTPYDVKGLFAEALHGDDPVLLLEHRELMTLKGRVPETAYRIPLGKAAVVRPGSDLTVVALARMVHQVLEVLPAAEAEGLSVELIDPRCVAPLDREAIAQSVAKTGRLLVIDEDFGPFGLGAEIAAAVQETVFDELDAPIRRLHGVHSPTPYSPSLEKAVVPQPEEILQAIREVAAY